MPSRNRPPPADVALLMNWTRARVWAALALVVLAACASTPPAASVLETGALADATVPLCTDVPEAAAPGEWYRDEPIYVANEMPVERIDEWARSKPGFEEIWIDRDHAGWIAVAFSEGAEQRQAELEREFPDVGVVAVPVDWTMAELTELQERVTTELDGIAMGSGILVTQGVVGISVGVLTDDAVSAVEEAFAGARVCLEGIPEADAPDPGPQAAAGDGWRLLGDEAGVGQPYRTGIATEQDAYEGLWDFIGLSGNPPPVDFEAEIVIWFGAVYGSSCPSLRLDDVIVDDGRDPPMVYAEIVDVDANMGCTADANPRAYVVALERGRLPSGPFGIQLSSDDPPAGWPEERILIDVDLSAPGAVAGPGNIRFDPSLPEPQFLESGGFVEPGFPTLYRLNVHCGAQWLGTLNDVAWRAENAPAGATDWMPDGWPDGGANGHLEVWVLLETDPPVLEATFNDTTVTYLPTTEDPPGCD